jgi:hypothetical protein
MKTSEMANSTTTWDFLYFLKLLADTNTRCQWFQDFDKPFEVTLVHGMIVISAHLCLVPVPVDETVPTKSQMKRYDSYDTLG